MRFDAVAVGYDGQAILPPLSAAIAAGELWAVIGANGAGKSTFVRTALGLQRPIAGAISRRPGLRLAYLPQQSSLDPIFPISVTDFVAMGRQGNGNHSGLFARRARRDHADAVRAALDEAGVAPLARRQLRDLSGGQRQRVLMARALVTDADLVFLDEPTAALDLASEREVLSLIERLRARRGAAVVMVTHLVEDGLERADRALLLDRDHEVALAGTPSALRAMPAFAQIYGRFVGRSAERSPERRAVNGPSWQELWSNLAIFKDAIWTGGLAGLLLGFIGVHVVLRRMVFASSAIAQAAALGVALSFWASAVADPVRHAAGHTAGPAAHLLPSLLFEPVIWAIAASLLATLVFIANPVHLHLTRESLLGLVFLIGGAGTVIVGSRISQEAHDLAAILFGSAVVVQPMDFYLVLGATIVLLGGHVLLWRPLLFVGYDPMGARVQGTPVRPLNAFLFVSVGLAVALCTRALGALPVFAFSVLPAMTALALTARITVVFALAAAIGAFSGVAGYAVSFRGDLPVGATQSATAAALLLIALVWRAVRARWKRRATARCSSRAPGPARRRAPTRRRTARAARAPPRRRDRWTAPGPGGEGSWPARRRARSPPTGSGCGSYQPWGCRRGRQRRRSPRRSGHHVRSPSSRRPGAKSPDRRRWRSPPARRRRSRTPRRAARRRRRPGSCDGRRPSHFSHPWVTVLENRNGSTLSITSTR